MAGLTPIALMLWAVVAGAQVTGPCTITVSTQGQASNVNSHSTPGTALPVRYGQVLRIDTVSTGAITAHQIDLELAGISWTADRGVDSGNEWGGEVNVSNYAGGYGLHKVTGISLGPGACSGTAYVLVEGGNPLGGPVGAGAAAATGVGALALATTTVRAGKEGGTDDEVLASVSDPLAKFEPPITRPWTPPSTEGDPNWPYEQTGPTAEEYAGQPAPPPKPFGIQLAEKINKGCMLALPAAILSTMATMVVGAGAAGAPQPFALRRVRWRPRISLVGLAGGLLMALGILVLLQQYGIVYPTLTVTVVGLVLGMLTSILIPSLVRVANVRRINRVIAAVEAGLSATEQVSPAEWQATHTVPPEGLLATETPDPNSEVIATLEAGLGVQVVTTKGDWAQVVAENGWWGWVDARELEQLPAVGSAKATEAAAETEAPADWYPDPSGEARLRYWDGTAWTDDTAD